MCGKKTHPKHSFGAVLLVLARVLCQYQCSMLVYPYFYTSSTLSKRFKWFFDCYRNVFNAQAIDHAAKEAMRRYNRPGEHNPLGERGTR